MTAAVARAVMLLAVRCLGESRREWARAMQLELETAIDEGKPLAFASGCLIAAWREMPMREEGRFVLVTYALALGVLVPMAVLQFACALGSPDMFPWQSEIYALLTPGSAKEPYMATAYLAAVPSLLGLWLVLGMSHLRLAWVLLERDWSSVLRIGALTVAIAATLVIFMGVLFLGDGRVVLQSALLAIELIAIFVLARWHARLFHDASAERMGARDQPQPS